MYLTPVWIPGANMPGPSLQNSNWAVPTCAGPSQNSIWCKPKPYPIKGSTNKHLQNSGYSVPWKRALDFHLTFHHFDILCSFLRAFFTQPHVKLTSGQRVADVQAIWQPIWSNRCCCLVDFTPAVWRGLSEVPQKVWLKDFDPNTGVKSTEPRWANTVSLTPNSSH